MQTVPTFNVLNGKEIEGPYSAGQLRLLEDSGSINGQSLIARHGEAEWLPLEAWRELIQGAPTHRGAVPGFSGKRRRENGGKVTQKSLARAVPYLMLLGVALVAAGNYLHIPVMWVGGASIMGFAFVIWLGTFGGE